MKKLIWILAMILQLLPLNGCAPHSEQVQLENLGLVGVVGYDIGSGGRSKITIAYPLTASDAEAKTQIYSTEVDVTREAIIEISKSSDRSIHLGQLRVVLFSEEYARQRGLEQVVKELYQDPVIGNNVLIAVVQGSIDEFLTDDPDKTSISTFLSDLLEPKIESYFNPYTSIHDFIYYLTNEVADPMTPYLTKENQKIGINEIAIFKRGRMIDTIAPWESNLLYGLARRKRMAAIKIQPEERKDQLGSILLEFVQSSVRIRSNKNFEQPRIGIHLDLKGQLYGYTGDLDLEDTDVKKGLQDEIARRLQESVENLLKELQDLQVDPVEMGEAFRMHYRGDWTKEMWNEMLPKVEYDIHVRFEITTTGNLR